MFEYKNYTCVPRWGRYHNGQNSLQLIDPKSAEDGEQIGTASVCVDQHISEDCVCIKNYNENVGVLEALVKAGIVVDTGNTLPVGYARANVCLILKKEGM
jgi:hypothetical protein